jgi:drug/metabolite transporter (DMT)-like permease
LHTRAQQYASPSHAAILVSLEPVFAAITALVLGQETLRGRTLLGAGLILAGILLAELRAPAAAESPVPSISAAE